MSQQAFRFIARQQGKTLVRDRRLMLVGVVLVLASIAALATGAARNERLERERTSATEADREAWRRQGVVNPHGAAHFGHYVARPVPPLSAFDPGLLDHLGTLVRLEAHRQNPAGARSSDRGTALNRFASFSAASALQVMVPLLVILTGFGVFAGERARTLLQQELAAGVRPQTLLLGRFVALGVMVLSMLGLFGLAGVIVLGSARAGIEELAHLALSISGYALYLLGVLALTLGVSALFRSARSALTVLLGWWVLAVWIVPTVTPDIATAVHPTPSGPELEEQVRASIDAQLDGGGPRESRPEHLKQKILEKYGVREISELPVNFSGALLEYSEEVSSQAYLDYVARLHDTYRQQETLTRAFSILSPLLALKGWSAALAGTDFEAHRQFLIDAERYRYAFVQRLNRDILVNRPAEYSDYVANVAQLTAALDDFAPSRVPLAAIVRRQVIDLLILAAWFAVSIGFALWSAVRLRRQP